LKHCEVALQNLLSTPELERAAEDVAPPPSIRKPAGLPKESGVWRTVRILIATPLIIFSLTALLPFSILPVSTQAVVNARLSEVRAPLEAKMGNVTLETGDFVSAGERLVTAGPPLSSLSTDEVKNGRSRASLEQEDARISAELAASEIEKSRYDQMYSQYLQHTASDLQMQISEAQKKLDDAKQRSTNAAADLKRAQQALKDHLISKMMLDQASDKADQAAQAVDSDESQLRVLQKQLSDAQSGYVLDQSKLPGFLAQRDAATNSVDQLREQKNALEQLLNGGPVSETEMKDSPYSRTSIVSPVNGTIWSRAVATGQTVQEGDELFRIADANSIHVEVWLDRRYGPQLSIGDTAFIYLGGMGKELTGKVTSFEGSSRRNMDEQVNAIDLLAVHPDQYHVSIELDPADRKAAYVGQAAKVLFPGSKHRIRASIYFWLTRL
jgi:multidrug resistance efflux pump